MKQIKLAFLAFATSIFCLNVPDLSDPKPRAGLPLPPRDNDGQQNCILRSTSGKTNGISQKWYYGFSDACKDALYLGSSPEDKQKDPGASPESFRYSSENWAARFETPPPNGGLPGPCFSMTIKCSDLVGHNADGRGWDNDLGKNFEHCWPHTDDKIYHGGEVSHIYIHPTWLNSQTPSECGTMKIWRCRDGECGADHDATNDPNRTGTLM